MDSDQVCWSTGTSNTPPTRVSCIKECSVHTAGWHTVWTKLKKLRKRIIHIYQTVRVCSALLSYISTNVEWSKSVNFLIHLLQTNKQAVQNCTKRLNGQLQTWLCCIKILTGREAIWNIRANKYKYNKIWSIEHRCALKQIIKQVRPEQSDSQADRWMEMFSNYLRGWGRL